MPISTVTPTVSPNVTARYGSVTHGIEPRTGGDGGRDEQANHPKSYNGKLSASRNEDGSYNIDESELARIYPDQWRNRHVIGTLKQDETPRTPDVLQAEIEGLQQQVALLRDERDDLRRRLDAEAEERRRLTRLLTDQRSAVSVPVEKPGGGLADWWRRLWSG